MGALLAGAGFVFTERAKENATQAEMGSSFRLFQDRMMAVMDTYGLWPLFFIMAGRPPAAFNDDGSIARPGIFLRAVDPNNPAKYYASGVLITIKKTAKRLKAPIHIPLIVTEGEHLTKPKTEKNAPYIEPVTRDQTIIHRLVALLEVPSTRGNSKIIRPGNNGGVEVSEVKFRKLEREMIRIFKEVTGIEEYLIQSVGQWGDHLDVNDAAARFAELAGTNEKLFITADRIRALHPRLSAATLGKEVPEIAADWEGLFRFTAQRSLLALLDNPDPIKLDQTLGAVTALVSAADYRDWSRIR
jgi:hypothetical protein